MFCVLFKLIFNENIEIEFFSNFQILEFPGLKFRVLHITWSTSSDPSQWEVLMVLEILKFSNMVYVSNEFYEFSPWIWLRNDLE